ncbi:hypothetical protein IM40_02585 [Candidatus Paracaedimonas acanthamoebae]|nr:hypothetical protein IM40_02585 [Candidatus Paracaedimonas acanthamoebae]
MGDNLIEKLELLEKQGTQQFFTKGKTDKKIIIDYCGPNIAKPMHLGHLRTTILGESLKRLLKFSGFTTIGDIHYGDHGPQMGCLLYGLKERSQNLHQVVESLQANPKLIFEIQKDVALRAAKDQKLDAKVRQEAITLQQAQGDYVSLRDKISAITLSEIQKMLDFLHVSFDQYSGESRYIPHIETVISLFKAKNLIETHQGNIMVPLGNSYSVFLKGNDEFLAYSSIDMAAIYERIYKQEADKIIYVIGNRQEHHWRQILGAWNRYGINTELIHRSHGYLLEQPNKAYKLDPYFGITMEQFLNEVEVFSSNFIHSHFPIPEEDFTCFKNFIALLFLKIDNFKQPLEEGYISFLKSPDFLAHPSAMVCFQCARIFGFEKHLNLNKDTPLEIEDQLQQNLAMHLLYFPKALEKSSDSLDLSPLCKHLLQITDIWKQFKDLSNLSLNGLRLLNISKRQVEEIFHIFAITLPPSIRNIANDLSH